MFLFICNNIQITENFKKIFFYFLKKIFPKKIQSLLIVFIFFSKKKKDFFNWQEGTNKFYMR